MNLELMNFEKSGSLADYSTILTFKIHNMFTKTKTKVDHNIVSQGCKLIRLSESFKDPATSWSYGQCHN
jgi:hypothetical protein